MLGTVFSSSLSSDFNPLRLTPALSFFPLTKIRRLTLRELKQLARGNMVGKWWGQFSNPGLSDPKLADLNNLERQYREACVDLCFYDSLVCPTSLPPVDRWRVNQRPHLGDLSQDGQRRNS